MNLRLWRAVAAVAVFSGLIPVPAARAVECVTQSQMKPADRDALAQAARALAANVQANNPAGIKAETIATVAAQFDSIAASIQTVASQIQGATLTVNALYKLNASDLKSPQDETQFFCGVSMSSMRVDINIPQLPPGDYALAILRATGVAHPQQMTMILQDEGGKWRLAGFFARPLMAAGHDGVWYWKQARDYAQKKQNWNAYFYYQTAAYLLAPVDFLVSPNLEKLQNEQGTVAPSGLPAAQPMTISSGGQSYSVTNLHTDGSLGGLDLVISYQGENISDPVATRTRNVDLMKTMLTAHPELREAFHGLWVYADAGNQRPFANELPMSQIQ